MSTIVASRYHDISCGHRVVGHESKCALLHGHNYRVHFTCRALQGLDMLGRVIDFSVMKTRLCLWLEDNWDHKFIAFDQDEVMQSIDRTLFAGRSRNPDADKACMSIVWVTFNPTAENLALYLVNRVGPVQLKGTGVELVTVRIEETRKCSAEVTIA